MKIEGKTIYDEMADYVANVPHNGFTGELEAWDGGWKRMIEDNNLHLNNLPPNGNISWCNVDLINYKKVNLLLYVVNAVKNHMVVSIDELN